MSGGRLNRDARCGRAFAHVTYASVRAYVHEKHSRRVERAMPETAGDTDHSE